MTNSQQLTAVMDAVGGQETKHPEHDCEDWVKNTWHNTEEYNMITCGICKKITKFRWKSNVRCLADFFWDRISN